jgi:hypothetical protein
VLSYYGFDRAAEGGVMEELRSPYSYIYTGRFTNRKWREVQFKMLLQSDAVFELHALTAYTKKHVVFSIRLPDIVESSIPSEICGDATFPWPIMPPCLFKPGKFLRCQVRLDEKVDLGRKRPTFEVIFHGINKYADINPGSSDSQETPPARSRRR